MQTAETFIQPAWQVLDSFENLLGRESWWTLPGSATNAIIMVPSVVSPEQNTTPMQQDPNYDTMHAHDDVSIDFEDVPAGDI